MNALNQLSESLYNAWIIGTKDILEAIKNKKTRTTLILMAAMVPFFYWLGTLRPFDKNVSVVVYDRGSSGITFETTTLQDGAVYTFSMVNSLKEMQEKMAHRNLGLLIPAGFDQTKPSDQVALQGYVFWADRIKAPELENRYTRDISQILGRPVQVHIGQNIVIPQPNIGGMQATVAYQILFFVFWTAIALVPSLMMEERRTRTLDALLVSPASNAQVVMGKALAGMFYVLLIGGIAFGLYWMYVTNWGLALLAFLGYAMFAIGVALALGSFVHSQQQHTLWGMVFLIVMIVPALFYTEPNLKAGIRKVFAWLPGTALASLFRFSCSNSIPSQLWQSLGVALFSIAAAYFLVAWQLRRTE